MKIWFNSFLTVLLTVGGVRVGNAQQAIKNRTSDTVMKHLAVSNGNNPSNIQGTNNINHGVSEDKSSATVRTAGGINLPTPEINITTTTIPNETIGSTTISFTGMLETTRQSSGEVVLTFIQQDGRTDTNNDGRRDGHFTKWILPTLQTNGNTIPHNTWVRLTTPGLTNLATGGTILGSRDDRFRRDVGQNKRVDETLNPIGNPENNNRVDWVEFLGIGTHEMTSADIYPNPAIDNITISTPEDASSKKIEIYNISGQMVITNIVHADTEHILNISSLTSGIYIITTEDNDGNKTLNKIMKK